MSADAKAGLAIFLIGIVLGVALAGFLVCRVGSGDKMQYLNGAKPEKSRWWLR
jgi:uncharacterized membrane protein YwzB